MTAAASASTSTAASSALWASERAPALPSALTAAPPLSRPASLRVPPVHRVGGLKHLQLADRAPAARITSRQGPRSPNLRAGALTRPGAREARVRGASSRTYANLDIVTWVADHAGPLALPGAPLALDLVEAIRGLHAQGRWVLEVALLIDRHWGARQHAYEGLTELVARQGHVQAVSALCSGDDRTCAVELYGDGLVWTSADADTESWLLGAHGLADLP
jgi:hypothetical protein